MLEKMLCKDSLTLKDAMKIINENAKGIVFIANEEEKIVGTLTDGDIRRLLIGGHGLNDVIRGKEFRDFTYAVEGEDVSSMFAKFNDKVRIIPILSETGKLVNCLEAGNMHVSLAQPQLIGNEYEYLLDAFLSTWISSSGEYITRFENEFSNYCGVKYGVATSNGTTALHLALSALNVGPGDEVIVPDITFAATINSVLYTGATPVIVDVERDGWCIDPKKIEEAITPATKAIIPVHIYGQPCNMEEICNIAEKNNLYIVEDCAEAHGAEFAHKKVGSFGVISCFSFFGNKVITTGEGGMCITNDKELSDKMRILRDHGMSKSRKYYHEVIGFNYRMTNLQAAIGLAQVERIDEILKWREALEKKYCSELENIHGVVLQSNNLHNRKKITWLVSILVDANKRDAIVNKLKMQNIDVRNFFIPLSEMNIYKKYARHCSNSHYLSERGINLPTTVEIDNKTIDKISNIIRNEMVNK